MEPLRQASFEVFKGKVFDRKLVRNMSPRYGQIMMALSQFLFPSSRVPTSTNSRLNMSVDLRL